MERIVCYKGFDKNLSCRGFQYEIGKTYKHDGQVKACESGFHACTNPFDVWDYYSVFDSRFALVELSGKTDDHDSDSKIAAAEITIKAELKMPEFVKKCVYYLIDLTRSADIEGSGNHTEMVSSGNFVKMATSGNCVEMVSSGNGAEMVSSGNGAEMVSSGNFVKMATSGDGAEMVTSGDGAKMVSSGDGAEMVSSGDGAEMVSSGDGAEMVAEGEKSVITSSGIGAVAKGICGTWVSLAEFDDNNNCIGFATGCIGKEGLKADVYYKAKDGKLVEVTK